MSSFTIRGTIYKDFLPFSGKEILATWTDGSVTIEGVDRDELYRVARERSRYEERVGPPGGPFYSPDNWNDPSAFLWWCLWLLGPTAKIEGSEWLPRLPGAPGDIH